MPHEPIRLEGKDWERAAPLVEYEINRTAVNVHDLRGEIQATSMRAEVARQTFHDDLHRTLSSHSVRIAVVEIKLVIYAFIAGSIGQLVMAWLSRKF